MLYFSETFFHVKQKICEIRENCSPQKKVPYGIELKISAIIE